MEKIPGSRCDECQKGREEQDAEVKAGGVFFRCKDCGANGALKAGTDYAKWVREQMKTPTGTCGVEFTKANCPVCGPN
jgi:hypothetical protein